MVYLRSKVDKSGCNDAEEGLNLRGSGHPAAVWILAQLKSIHLIIAAEAYRPQSYRPCRRATAKASDRLILSRVNVGEHKEVREGSISYSRVNCNHRRQELLSNRGTAKKLVAVWRRSVRPRRASGEPVAMNPAEKVRGKE